MQTYYITQYALTKGIIEVRGELCISRRFDGSVLDDYGGRMVAVHWGNRRVTFHKPHWHATLEDALSQAARMIGAKIASVDRQRATLERLRLQGPKVVPAS